MNKSNSKTDSKQLADTVQMARLRVATAENRWKAAKEQARVAKRRRKEVRLIARRAKKQAQQAKADLSEAREALAEAEAKLARSGLRTVKAKPRKKPVKKIPAAPQKKVAQSSRHSASKAVKPKIPSPGPTRPGSRVRPKVGRSQARVTVPRDWEAPVPIPATPGGGETHAGGVEAEQPVNPAPPDSALP